MSIMSVQVVMTYIRSKIKNQLPKIYKMLFSFCFMELKDLKKDDPNYESIQRIVNERRRSVQREDITKRILLNISEYAFKLKINESRITEKLREEFPTPITYLLVGPMGSGKSIIQRRT